MIKKMDAKTDFSTFIRTELGGPSQLKPCSKGNSCFILISTTTRALLNGHNVSFPTFLRLYSLSLKNQNHCPIKMYPLYKQLILT